MQFSDHKQETRLSKAKAILDVTSCINRVVEHQYNGIMSLNFSGSSEAELAIVQNLHIDIAQMHFRATAYGKPSRQRITYNHSKVPAKLYFHHSRSLLKGLRLQHPHLSLLPT